MKKRERSQAEREAVQIAHLHTQREEGHWFGETKSDGLPVSREMIRRYNASTGDLKACPHLQADHDQAKFWVESVPELLACRQCTHHVVVEEKKRANSCCIMCGEHVALRGFTVAVDGVVMRAGVCEECEVEAGMALS